MLAVFKKNATTDYCCAFVFKEDRAKNLTIKGGPSVLWFWKEKKQMLKVFIPTPEYNRFVWTTFSLIGKHGDERRHGNPFNEHKLE